MKKLILSSTLIMLAAGSASAQVAFEHGDVAFGYAFSPETSGDVSAIDLAVRGDYSVGLMGVQLDGYASALFGDVSDTVNMFTVGGHVYKQFNDGIKAGAYFGYDTIALGPQTQNILNYGVEGMASFGSFDIEASLGWLDLENSINGALFVGGVDVYYNISPSFEVYAGYENLSDTGNSTNLYEIGAGYTLSNMPVTIGATYGYIDSNSGVSVIGVNVSYSFGGSTDGRLFSTKRYPFEFLTGSPL